MYIRQCRGPSLTYLCSRGSPCLSPTCVAEGAVGCVAPVLMSVTVVFRRCTGVEGAETLKGAALKGITPDGEALKGAGLEGRELGGPGPDAGRMGSGATGDAVDSAATGHDVKYSQHEH